MKYEVTAQVRKYLPDDLVKKVYNIERMLRKLAPDYRPKTHASPRGRKRRGQQQMNF